MIANLALPALIAAFISALVSITGWWVAHARERSAERRRRREKTIDVQKALRAEIRHHLVQLQQSEFDAHMAEVDRAVAVDPHAIPMPSREAPDAIFQAFVDQIHILPTSAVDPVVAFYAQVQATAAFAKDLRSEIFVRLDPEKRLRAYRDYIDMKRAALIYAERAFGALNASIKKMDVVDANSRV